MFDSLRKLFKKGINAPASQEKPQSTRDTERPKKVEKLEVIALSTEQIQFNRYCERTSKGFKIQQRENYKDLLKSILENPSLIGLCKAEKTTRGYAGIPMPTGENETPAYIDAVFFSRGRVYVCTLSDAAFVRDDIGKKGIFQNSGEDINLARQRLETACNYVYTHFGFQPYALLARSPEKSGLVIFQVFSTKKK